MPYRLGIDLGTTFTAAAICRPAPDGTVLSELVPLGTRSHSVPSVLFVSGGSMLVGEAAERRALTDPGCVVRDFKRRLGDDTPIVVDGRPHHAHELAADLVRWVVARVTEREGEPPDAIAVTHPAAWGPHRTTVLEKALGADVLLLTEPQAAAMHYASAARVEAGSTIAVYDLGGGTFDAAVVHKTQSGGFELLGRPDGIECLGGIDFDDAILAHVLPPTGCTDPVAMARLRRECTEAKEALSSDTSAVVPVLLPDVRTQVPLTRTGFESLIRPILADTVASLSRAITSAGRTPDEVSAVLLVGGSSRIPLVGSLITEALERPVAVDTDPKGVVALGAALAAHQSVAPPPPVQEIDIPEPRRPDHDCDPPALKRPKRRLRRTRVVLYALGMMILALAVIPSPFTSDSTQPSTNDSDTSQGTNGPAGGNGSSPQQSGTTKKRTPKPGSPAEPGAPEEVAVTAEQAAQQAGTTQPGAAAGATSAGTTSSGATSGAAPPVALRNDEPPAGSPASATGTSSGTTQPADTTPISPTETQQPPPPVTEEPPPPPPPATTDDTPPPASPDPPPAETPPSPSGP